MLVLYQEGPQPMTGKSPASDLPAVTRRQLAYGSVPIPQIAGCVHLTIRWPWPQEQSSFA